MDAFVPVFKTSLHLPSVEGKTGCLMCAAWLSLPALDGPEEICPSCEARHRLLPTQEVAAALQDTYQRSGTAARTGPDLGHTGGHYLLAVGGNAAKQTEL